MKIIENIRKRDRAFEGDTYLDGCERAMRARPSWVRAMLFGAIFAAIVDLSNFHQLIAQALDVGESNPTGWLVALACVLAYVALGFGIGNPLRAYRAFGDKAQLAITVICGAGVAFAVGVVTFFRVGVQGDVATIAEQATALDPTAAASSALAGETSVTTIDPVYATAFYTAMMVVGALMSAVYSYYRYDALAERVYTESKAACAHDRRVYERTFQSIMCDAEEEARLERDERKLENQMAEAVLRVNTIATQAAMVLDPADAYEVARASRIVTTAYRGADMPDEPQEGHLEPVVLKHVS